MGIMLRMSLLPSLAAKNKCLGQNNKSPNVKREIIYHWCVSIAGAQVARADRMPLGRMSYRDGGGCYAYEEYLATR
jgi:hypothetical protein